MTSALKVQSFRNNWKGHLSVDGPRTPLHCMARLCYSSVPGLSQQHEGNSKIHVLHSQGHGSRAEGMQTGAGRTGHSQGHGP